MLRIFLLTTAAMLAFAGNSVLCRLALKSGHIDPLTFTFIRLFSGACVLALLVALTTLRRRPASSTLGNAALARDFPLRSQGAGVDSVAPVFEGSWLGAIALGGYAVTFSLAYVDMDTGPGALILFAAVQFSMLAFGFIRGERLDFLGTIGFGLSLISLAVLLLPGSTAPPLMSAVLMFTAGMAWAGYTLHGRRARSPAAATAGNFLRAVPLALVLTLPFLATLHWDAVGLGYAILSGAGTSGLGYVIWYRVVRQMTVTRAGIVQLSVPVLSVLAGAWWLHEPLTLRVVLSSVGVLSGVAIVLMAKER